MYPYEQPQSLVEIVAEIADTEKRQAKALRFFPDEQQYQNFMRQVQGRITMENDRLADFDAAERRKFLDHERRVVWARDEVKREKLERRLSGELDAPAAAFLDTFEANLLDIDQLYSKPRPEALVDGLLFRDSLAWFAGPSNTYKSFLALDLVARCAKGTSFYHGVDMPMEQTKCLIVVAEGGGAYGDRVRAWEKKHGHIPRDQMKVYDRAVQLGDMVTEMPALLAHVQRQKLAGTGYGLIVFDTQAMCTVGVSESDNTEMGVIMNVLHQLREATGACILLVHHFGGNEDKGMRGATAIYAAATTVVHVSKKSEFQVALSTKGPKGKQKDAEAMDCLLLDLEKVSDPEGAWDSLVPSRGRLAPSVVSGEALDDRQRLLLAALADTELTGGLGTTDLARLVTEAEGPNPDTGKGWAPATAQRWAETLMRHEWVVKVGTKYRITDQGKAALRPVEDDD